MAINWKNFYEKEAKFKRFIPGEDLKEIQRINLVMFLSPKENIQSVLDVGCGDGYLCHLFKEKGVKNISGVDLSETRVKYAKSKFPDIEFRQAEVYRLPFKDNSFELITAVELLEHLEDPSAAIKELKRVSNKYILITVPNNEKIQQIICPHCLKVFLLSGHIQSFDRKRIELLCRETNLEIKKIDISKFYIDKPLFRKLFWPLARGIFRNYFESGGYLGVLCEKG